MMFKLQATSYKLQAIRPQRLKARLTSLLVYSLWSIVYGLITLVLISSLRAEATSLKDILNSPEKFDKKIVEVEGETIGEPLKEKEGMWVNILSQGDHIGVFVSNKAMLKEVKYWGSYREQGDYVRIRGIFYKDCPLHRQRDIHAQDLSILESGFLKRESISPFKIKLAIGFFIISLVLTIIYFIRLHTHS